MSFSECVPLKNIGFPKVEVPQKNHPFPKPPNRGDRAPWRSGDQTRMANGNKELEAVAERHIT
jgi:hypothetical protein